MGWNLCTGIYSFHLISSFLPTLLCVCVLALWQIVFSCWPVCWSTAVQGCFPTLHPICSNVQILDLYRHNLRSKVWAYITSHMFTVQGSTYWWFCLAPALVFNQPPTPTPKDTIWIFAFQSIRPSHWVPKRPSSKQPTNLQICLLKTVKLHPPWFNLSKQTAGHFTYLGHSHLHFSDYLTRLSCSLDPSNLNNDRKRHKMPFGLQSFAKRHFAMSCTGLASIDN